MPVTHEPWLVALSLVVAIQGAFVGLSLAVQVGEAAGARRRWLIAGAALSLGVAIWAMHFVGMLAVRLPFPVDYLVFPTLLSFLVCVLVVGAAVFSASAGTLTMNRLAASAVFMGLGIVSMHYIGMAALHASTGMRHDPAFVAASVAIAIAASGLALRLATTSHGRPPLLISAAALGMAISGMHYTAMAGLTLMPHAEMVASTAPALSVDLLAIVVAVVAFVVSGLFLLILVPEREEEAARGPARRGVPDDAIAVLAAEGPAAPPDAGFPTAAAEAAAGDGAADASAASRQLPVEQDGATRYIPVASIVAVHANAHYTTIFDGKQKYFCPLAIGDVEARLDPARFARVHRSHIVAVDRVAKLRKAGHSGRAELAGGEAVPVARARLAALRAMVGTDARAAAS